jgi:hypothetical protein
MVYKSASSFCVVLLVAVSASAQAPPATPPAQPPNVVAGIPVNYDEAKVGTYVLPDALKLEDGKPVRNAKTWTQKRRPEIVKLFETQQYGVAPGRPADESFEVTDKGTPALGGKAIRKQVTIHLAKDSSAPVIHLLEYLPAGAKGKVPMFFTISFGPIQNTTDDPGIVPDKVRDPKTNELVTATPPVAGRMVFGRVPVERFLDAGIGVATFYYAELDPDSLTGFAEGIRAQYKRPGQTGEDDRAADAWGSISAWAWGMSRVQDYFETDPGVDAKRVAIQGVSRLGKTVMWAGAHDERFAAVIASCSGEGGAALSRRDYGETIAHLTAPSRYPYQFAANYAKYGGFPDTAPMDANMLVALVAPRPLLLQTGSTDKWSDPKGEFLAAVAAGPLYKLLGRQDLGTDVWPAAKTPIFSNGLNYYMHEGPHGMVASDWDIYLQFLKAQFHPEQ